MEHVAAARPRLAPEPHGGRIPDTQLVPVGARLAENHVHGGRLGPGIGDPRHEEDRLRRRVDVVVQETRGAVREELLAHETSEGDDALGRVAHKYVRRLEGRRGNPLQRHLDLPLGVEAVLAGCQHADAEQRPLAVSGNHG